MSFVLNERVGTDPLPDQAAGLRGRAADLVMDRWLGEKRRVTAEGTSEDEVKAALDLAVEALEPQGRWAFFSQRIKITTRASGADEVTGWRTVALISMQPLRDNVLQSGSYATPRR